jgi:dihydrofolate reductase
VAGVSGFYALLRPWDETGEDMRKLIEATFVSLDGIVSAPERWALPLWSEENKKHSLAELMECDGFLLGRINYEAFASRWSKVRGDEYIDRLNELPKYVASQTLQETSWNSATLIKDDVATEIAALKQQPGNSILKYGTGNLDRTLVQHGLIDEFRFLIFPVAAGKGARLFEGIDTSHLKLTLINSKVFENGLLRASYSATYR